MRCTVFLFLLGLLPAGAGPVAAEEPYLQPEEQLLRDAEVKIDGSSLLKFIRRCTPVFRSPAEIDRLIQQLGHERFIRREQATQELIDLGRLAEKPLRQAMQQGDGEIASRATECLRQIQQQPSPAVQKAVIRYLAVQQPASTTSALLAYVPFAPDEAVKLEVRRALRAIAQRSGQIEPVLRDALHDPLPARRTLAAEVLCLTGSAADKLAVRSLLRDAEPVVRLRVGLALVRCKDKAAIPVLIDLLPELDLYQVSQIEEILYQLAGETGPPLTLSNPDPPERIRDAWRTWWHKHQDSIKLR